MKVWRSLSISIVVLGLVSGCTPPHGGGTVPRSSDEQTSVSTDGSSDSISPSPSRTDHEEAPESSGAGGDDEGASTSGSAVPSPGVESGTGEGQSSASPSDQPSTFALTVVEVQISRAGWDQSTGAIIGAGLVLGAVESGGVCTLSAVMDGETVSASSAGSPDAAVTACGEIPLTSDRLVSGVWLITLDYASDTVHGRSEPVAVQIP